MQKYIYSLPELTFVGGKTQDFYFSLVDNDGNPFDASGCTVNLSICNYSNKTGEPLISMMPRVISMDGNIKDTVYVNIPAKATSLLVGKYIYQLTIMDIRGKVDIPNQGIMNITKNINDGFLSQY